MRRAALAILLPMILLAGRVFGLPRIKVPPPSEPAQAQWLDAMPAAYQDAQDSGRPIFVVVGAAWCEPCKQLHDEMDKPAVSRKLGVWTCVSLDADKPQEVPLTLAVGTLPALRVLDGSGKVIASREGPVSIDELLTWLNENYKQALPAPGDDLLGNQRLDAAMVNRLVGRLGETNPAIREACVRRLRDAQALAAAPVAETLISGKLAARLSALSVLRQWKAPVDGLDPWQPESITPERVAKLKAWAQAVSEGKIAPVPRALSAADLAAAREQLDRLVLVDSTPEMEACRERLAGFGTALLPEVRERLKATASDRARERLTALRYRLAANDTLALGWLGGLDRLASTDVQVRRRAAQELATRALPSDAPLLLEMFSDPDPSLREISLKALRKVSGADATGALIQLLHDPEPNVRAAVLKELAETPSPTLAGPIIAYVQAEKDIDLVCHGVRVLREVHSRAAIDCLIGLLDHPAWRVRGEAADALIDDLNHANDEQKTDIYAALIKRLGDDDSFVVGRAVAALRRASMSSAIEPLVKAAENHPDVAADIFEAMSGMGENSGDRDRVVVYLRSFCTHADPRIRAAALARLIEMTPDAIEQEVLAAFKDKDLSVRIEAVHGLYRSIVRQRPDNNWHDHWATPQEFDDFHAGKTRPAWFDKTIPDLQAMMGPELTAEHFAVASALTALGFDQQTMPLYVAAVDNPQWRNAAIEVLPWVPFEEREKLFNALMATNPPRQRIIKIAQHMADVSDVRAAPLLWGLLAGKDMAVQEIYALPEALHQLYVGPVPNEDLSRIPAALRNKLVADCTEKAAHGSDMQRTVALELLLKTSPSDAVEVAQKVMADPSSSEWNKVDAFQIMLLSMDKPEAQKAAVEALSSKELYQRKIAVPYLVWGRPGLGVLRGVRNLNISDESSYSSGQIIVVTPPPGLKAEVVKPLLASGVEYVPPSLVGYLLCLTGDKDGFTSLVNDWRANHPQEDNWKALVYRAVTVLDDDSLTPVLEEIYHTYRANNEDWYIREFYWTIRSMTGPNVLKLRKQIRDEVGMDKLR